MINVIIENKSPPSPHTQTQTYTVTNMMYITKPAQLLIIKKNNNEVHKCLRTFEIHSNEDLVDKYSDHLFMALMFIIIQGVI